jgi:hypothetical protein
VPTTLNQQRSSQFLGKACCSAAGAIDGSLDASGLAACRVQTESVTATTALPPFKASPPAPTPENKISASFDVKILTPEAVKAAADASESGTAGGLKIATPAAGGKALDAPARPEAKAGHAHEAAGKTGGNAGN